MSFSIVQGDLAPDLELQVLENGAPKNISTGYTSWGMRWRKPDGTITTVALSVVDPTTGLLVYMWQPGDTDVTGLHHGTVTGIRNTGAPQTFPSDSTAARWAVSPRLS